MVRYTNPDALFSFVFVKEVEVVVVVVVAVVVQVNGHSARCLGFD